MIYDDAVAQDPAAIPFRFPIPAAGEDSDYVIKGATWEELAANISDRLDALRGQARSPRASVRTSSWPTTSSTS
jgi:hypothetical protein